MKQIEAMAEGVKEIEKGNLAYRIEKKGEDEIASLTENINNMAEELMNNIEKERKLEKQRTSLLRMYLTIYVTPLNFYYRVTCDYFEILNMKIKNNMMSIRELLCEVGAVKEFNRRFI